MLIEETKQVNTQFSVFRGTGARNQRIYRRRKAAISKAVKIPAKYIVSFLNFLKNESF
jgi:hypothetical protein